MVKEKYPYKLTKFTTKKDAQYAGDPKGDFVMAKDINKVQEAISRIEKVIGLSENNFLSIYERIQRINNLTTMEMNSVGYFDSLETTNISYIDSILEKYSIVILNKHDANTKVLTNKHTIYGRINGSNSNLNIIQQEIGIWKKQGVQGIYIDSLNQTSRDQEINIYNSVVQEGLKVIISGNINNLLTNSIDNYNTQEKSIPFTEDTILLIRDFGYDKNQTTQKYASQQYIMNTLLPLVQKIRSNNLEIMVSADTPNRKAYSFVHGLGLLLGLDYAYTGRNTGSLINQLPQEYNTNNISAKWKTKNPLIFNEESVLYRSLPGGAIEIDRNNNVTYPGLMTTSEVIKWINESVDGSFIKKASIPPDRLRTYDIHKIVDLLNNSPDSVQINSTKVETTESSSVLPLNIPTSHLTKNVIEAINKKNNAFSKEEKQIEDDAILELDAKKLKNSIMPEQLLENIIDSVNRSAGEPSTDPNYNKKYITIPYAEVTNLKGSGDINYNRIIGASGSLTNLTVNELIGTSRINVTTKLTAKEAEIGTIKSDRIITSKLEGLDSLSVKNLEAENIGSLVLKTIDLYAGSARINKIVTESLKAETIVSELIQATTSYGDFADFDKANIDKMVTDSLTARHGFFKDLVAAQINTDLLSISSKNGVLNINSDTIKIYGTPGKKGKSDIRILIGNLQEATGNKDDYGFMALDSTGKNKIFDHTGVYEGGIHKDAITTESLKEGAVTGGKISHNSIVVKHLQGGTITAGWLDADSVTSDKIEAKAITSPKIHGNAITSEHISSSAIEAGHINSNSIISRHIQSGAISTEHLKVGFKANLIKSGMDSFEQFNTGQVELSSLNKNIQAYIQEENALEGEKSLRVFSAINNNYLHIGKKITTVSYPEEENDFAFSLFVKKENIATNTKIRLGLMLSEHNKQDIYQMGEYFNVNSLYERKSFILSNLEGYSYITPVIQFENSNDTIIIDALQVEAIPVGGEISPWRTTATTTISGDNITTGKIDAKHIKVGDGTVFGDGQIIEISDSGILARSDEGSAFIGAEGIVINKGAFRLDGGMGKQTITIDGNKGLSINSLSSKIILDTEIGFQIQNLEKDEIVLSVNPETQNLRFSGNAEFYMPGSEKTSITFQEQQLELEKKADQEKVDKAIKDIELTPGPEGPYGDSAYKIAVQNGFKGTEEDWIKSLEGEDAYNVQLIAENGSVFKNGVINTYIKAVVYKGKKDVTDLIDANRFKWKRISEDFKGDNEWNNRNFSGTKKIKITREDVYRRATFVCEIEKENG